MGETPRRSLRDAKSVACFSVRVRGLANAALSLLASPLLPKGEANAFSTRRSAFAERLVEKGEDRAAS